VVERKHGEPCSALRETNAVAGETRVPAGMIDSHVVQLQQPWLHRYVIARLQTHSDIATTTRLTVTKLFTALHAMQTRSSDENSIRLSVRHTRAL